MTGEPSTWFPKLLKQSWVTPVIHGWMTERAAELGVPQDDQPPAENVASIWNLIPANTQGYFDDGACEYHAALNPPPSTPPRAIRI